MKIDKEFSDLKKIDNFLDQEAEGAFTKDQVRAANKLLNGIEKEGFVGYDAEKPLDAVASEIDDILSALNKFSGLTATSRKKELSQEVKRALTGRLETLKNEKDLLSEPNDDDYDAYALAAKIDVEGVEDGTIDDMHGL